MVGVKKENMVARILFIVGLTMIPFSFILGLIFGFFEGPFGEITFIGSIVIIWTGAGLVCGLVLIGIAEMVEFLNKINHQLAGTSGGAAPVPLKNGNDTKQEKLKEEKIQPINDADVERIHKVYKHRQVEKIIPTPFKYFCIVKLSDKTSIDVVELGGFVPRVLADNESTHIQNEIKAWYENSYSKNKK